ncbi:hypothetical protein EVAR_62282_1 [Eumeta japonica]|uniref:Uncharacterized protein n=1 Tax=Eumeta variegata TaxID=151549 RepID=A0A4C1Z0J0_EUMVA|nr:hypothetical protein EVAR_62282_1 [Eumeta japonica]
MSQSIDSNLSLYRQPIKSEVSRVGSFLPGPNGSPGRFGLIKVPRELSMRYDHNRNGGQDRGRDPDQYHDRLAIETKFGIATCIKIELTYILMNVTVA